MSDANKLLRVIEKFEPITKSALSNRAFSRRFVRKQTELDALISEVLDRELVKMEVKYRPGRGGNPAIFTLTEKGRNELANP